MVVKRLNIAEDLYGSLPYFDVSDPQYGAVLDGVTDDTPAVQAALDDAVTVGGGRIVIPRGAAATIKSPGVYVDTTTNRGVYIFQGEGTASKIRFDEIVNSNGIAIGNAHTMMFRDIALTGGISGVNSDTTTDCTYAAVSAAACDNLILDNVVVAGIKTTHTTSGGTLGGVVACFGGHMILRDVVFGGCTTPNDGVLRGKAIGQCILDNVFFVDFIQLGGITYNKLSITQSTKNWIRITDPLTLASSTMGQEMLTFRNVRMDENTQEALIYAVGDAERSARLDAVSLNGGFDSGAFSAAILSTFRKVSLSNCHVGIDINTTDYESFRFTDVGSVEIDNLLHKYGAKYITLAGTTGKLAISDSRLQGNGTHTTGINNSAGATITGSGLPNQL